jgi:hypothetical protein
MFDQISKLKDHVNVSIKKASIMKAVQVDESKDTNTMCSLGESLYTDSNQLDMKVFEYLL